ncbi:MAG: carboxypeptidase-like regulatory domain-containing protein [Anaerovoracaceae bacterium]
MIQKIILFFLLGGILLPMHAQINGTVVDSESNPISFANVALYTVPDSMLIAGTITNREGHFSLNTENQIDAFIKVSFIGFDLRSTYLQTENTDLRQQLNMNYRNNGWDLFGTLKYERYAYLQESIIRQSTYVDTLWTQENQLRVDGLSNPLTVVAGINYEFSPKQQAGVKYTLTTFPGKNRDIANTISDVYANGSFYDRLVSQDHQQQDLQPRHRLNGYYCGTFGKLTVDFNGDFYRSIQTTRSNITETSEEQDDRTIGSDNRIFNRLFATRTSSLIHYWGVPFRWGTSLPVRIVRMTTKPVTR